MKHFLYPILFLFGLNLLSAQVYDDFSDGNLFENPTWFGQDSLFQVNTAKQLQSRSYNNNIGQRILYTIQTPENSMEWRVWLRIAFNPSSQNFARWILCAEDSSLKNGYYIQLGGASGNLDSISLYKELNGQRTCLIPGRPGTLGKSNNWVQLIVKRDGNGVWQLFTDTAQNNQFIAEGSAMDTSIKIGNHHGFLFQCTAGNVANFYADDIYAGAPIIDKTPPQLKQVEILNNIMVKLSFSEKIDSIASNQIWFSQKQKANAASINKLDWILTLEDSLIEDSFFVLRLNQLSDLAKNTLDTQITLVYHIPKVGEVLITEFMPDPEPVIGLPNAEFVELFNTSRYPINLANFSIGDAAIVSKIPLQIMEPFSYVILCAAKDSSLFRPYGKLIGLLQWPSLNNSSDSLRLFYKQELWQEIAYDLTYYNSKEKESGGYSLSMLNPFHTCYKKKNWLASTSTLGGSPGTENPGWMNQKDSSKAVLLNIDYFAPNKLLLEFNKSVILQNSWQNYLGLQGVSIDKITPDPFDDKKIHLHFKDTLVHLKQYSFNLYPIEDCLENKSKQQIQFTYLEAKIPKQNQLLISEIYFDESRKGNFPQREFIELYNASEHPINLLNMNYSDATTQVKLPHYILPSKSYLIICALSSQSEFLSHGKTIGISPWPNLNSSDQLTLLDSNGYLLHQVKYTDAWLKSSAKNFSCSIEMIDLNNPCGKQNNWAASQNLNGASPGKKNSHTQPKRDQTAPQLLRVFVQNPYQLQVQFTEDLDSLSLLDSNQFLLNFTTTPFHFYFDSKKRYQLYLNFADSFQKEREYKLNILPVKDCALNESEQQISLPFKVPQEPKTGMLSINELLFNPDNNKNDFIELYNSSEEHLNISKLQLCRLNEQHIQEQCQVFAEEGIQLAPKEYLAISVQPELAQNTSFFRFPALWVEHEIPNMNDDKGTILLINEENIVLDSVVYDEQMHVSFLRNKEGVSLEKINPFISGTVAGNWTSAAETKNFSTPAERNSHYRTSAINQTNFSCLQPYFSPDSDGLNDIITFEYYTGEGVWIADLFIYNLQGMLIKEICKSKLLATSGELNWRGDTDTGERASIGNYIAYFNCYSNAGKTEQSKITISLLLK